MAVPPHEDNAPGASEDPQADGEPPLNEDVNPPPSTLPNGGDDESGDSGSGWGPDPYHPGNQDTGSHFVCPPGRVPVITGSDRHPDGQRHIFYECWDRDSAPGYNNDAPWQKPRGGGGWNGPEPAPYREPQTPAECREYADDQYAFEIWHCRSERAMLGPFSAADGYVDGFEKFALAAGSIVTSAILLRLLTAGRLGAAATGAAAGAAVGGAAAVGGWALIGGAAVVVGAGAFGGWAGYQKWLNDEEAKYRKCCIEAMNRRDTLIRQGCHTARTPVSPPGDTMPTPLSQGPTRQLAVHVPGAAAAPQSQVSRSFLSKPYVQAVAAKVCAIALVAAWLATNVARSPRK
jgi:hypothetical protein